MRHFRIIFLWKNERHSLLGKYNQAETNDLLSAMRAEHWVCWAEEIL